MASFRTVHPQAGRIPAPATAPVFRTGTAARRNERESGQHTDGGNRQKRSGGVRRDEEMRSHLKKIADDQVPVRAMSNGTFYARCTLAFCPEIESEPRLIVENGRLLNDDVISINYSVDAYIYACETRVLEVYEAGPGRTSLRVALPQRIAKFDRREASRVVPSHASPVLVRLSGDTGWTEAEADNISLYGLALSMTGPCKTVAGSRIAVEIVLPMLGVIEAQAQVQSISKSGGFAKLGLELEIQRDYDRGALAQYIRLRQIDVRRVRKRSGRPENERTFVITKETEEGTCLFLCTDSSVGRIEDFGHFSQVLSLDVLGYLTPDSATTE